jgi:hypothetical protein
MQLLPPWPNNINRRGKIVDPDGSVFYFTISDEIVHQSSQPPLEKLFYLQKIQYEATGEIEFRLGYYIIGKKPRSKGKWVWGQFASMMGSEDFKALIAEAIKRNWI